MVYFMLTLPAEPENYGHRGNSMQNPIGKIVREDYSGKAVLLIQIMTEH